MFKVDPSRIIKVRTDAELAKDIENEAEFPLKADSAKLAKHWDSMVNHLKRGQSSKAILRNAYAFIDEAVKGMAAYSVCQRGCAHCCYLDVDITELEADYIARQTGHKIVLGNLDRKKMANETYCPFLDHQTASCSIYEYRPAVCRWFFAYDDPQRCNEPNKKHAISTVNGLPSNEHLRKIPRYLSEATASPHRDIRQFFSTVNINKNK